MERQYLCLRCIHLEVIEVEGRYYNITPRRVTYEPPYEGYFCKAQHQTIIVLRKACPHYININQHMMEVNKKGMVDITDIPAEEPRIELSDLPAEVELKATGEHMVSAGEGKVGGLVIDYTLRDGRTFSQKYTKVSGAVLGTALRQLKLKDTEDLQKAWYVYALTPMRIGFARMIPIRKHEAQ